MKKKKEEGREREKESKVMAKQNGQRERQRQYPPSGRRTTRYHGVSNDVSGAAAGCTAQVEQKIRERRAIPLQRKGKPKTKEVVDKHQTQRREITPSSNLAARRSEERKEGRAPKAPPVVLSVLRIRQDFAQCNQHGGKVRRKKRAIVPQKGARIIVTITPRQTFCKRTRVKKQKRMSEKNRETASWLSTKVNCCISCFPIFIFTPRSITSVVAPIEKAEVRKEKKEAAF